MWRDVKNAIRRKVGRYPLRKPFQHGKRYICPENILSLRDGFNVLYNLSRSNQTNWFLGGLPLVVIPFQILDALLQFLERRQLFLTGVAYVLRPINVHDHGRHHYLWWHTECFRYHHRALREL